jgi:hypothetical protein
MSTADDRIRGEAQQLSADSTTYVNNLDELFPGAIPEVLM